MPTIPQRVAAKGRLNSVLDPRAVPGCVIYLTADSVVLDGSNNISQWTDLSGQGNHFTQAAPGTRPAGLTTGINSKSSILVPATTVSLVCVNTMATIMGAATAAERFILAQYRQDTSSAGTSINWGSGDSGSFMKYIDNTPYDGLCTTVRKNGSAIPVGVTTSPFIQNVRSTNGSFILQMNGVTFLNTATNTFGTGSTAPSIMFVGGGVSVPSMWRKVALYNRFLTAAERAFVSSCMN